MSLLLRIRRCKNFTFPIIPITFRYNYLKTSHFNSSMRSDQDITTTECVYYYTPFYTRFKGVMSVYIWAYAMYIILPMGVQTIHTACISLILYIFFRITICAMTMSLRENCVRGTYQHHHDTQTWHMINVKSTERLLLIAYSRVWWYGIYIDICFRAHK